MTLTDFFDNIYYFCYYKSPNKINLLFGRSIKIVANFVLPIYFIFTSKSAGNRIGINQNEVDVIVSLTSFPARINHVWKTIETILRQRVKPKRIILWLSKVQFPSKNTLPTNLLKLEERGLEIILVDGDMKSYKKYLYLLSLPHVNNFVIVDDDVFYSSQLVSSLWESHKKYPNDVICTHSKTIVRDNTGIAPYSTWEINASGTTEVRSNKLLPVGVGGVLYPKPSLYTDAGRIDLINQLCPSVDDLWLKTMTLLQGVSTVQTKKRFSYLPIIIKNNKTLFSINKEEGNDRQLDNIRNYYRNTELGDPFEII